MKSLYDFVHKKCNNIIDGKTIIDSIISTKRALNANLTELELGQIRETIINNNKINYERSFPPIVVEQMEKGEIKNSHILANEHNKFDFSDYKKR
jgi:hypothetical protein